jgi:hypothetical protein
MSMERAYTLARAIKDDTHALSQAYDIRHDRLTRKMLERKAPALVKVAAETVGEFPTGIRNGNYDSPGNMIVFQRSCYTIPTIEAALELLFPGRGQNVRG